MESEEERGSAKKLIWEKRTLLPAFPLVTETIKWYTLSLKCIYRKNYMCLCITIFILFSWISFYVELFFLLLGFSSLLCIIIRKVCSQCSTLSNSIHMHIVVHSFSQELMLGIKRKFHFGYTIHIFIFTCIETVSHTNTNTYKVNGMPLILAAV